MGRVNHCTESYCSVTENCYNDEQSCGRIPGHSGPCRCGYHQGLADEKSLRRAVERGKIRPTNFTPIEELPHEDPLIRKAVEILKKTSNVPVYPPVWPTGNEGGFTPATGPGTIGDALFDKMQTPEAKEAAERLFKATPEELGATARLAASGVTPEERSTILALAHEKFWKREYATEQLLRGLLVRSDRVKAAEDDATRRYRQAMDAQANVDQLQRKLDAAVATTQTQGKLLTEIGEVRDGLQRKLTYTEKNLAEMDRLRKKHFADAQSYKAKLEVRTSATTWTSAAGEVLAPKQFNAGHLMNTIRFIERLPATEIEELICDYDGDAGPIMVEGLPPGPDRYNVYPLLLKEARKRGLLIASDRVELSNTSGLVFTERKD